MHIDGQILDDIWVNIGVRWDKPPSDNPKNGGLELYINSELIAKTVLPQFNARGTTEFTPVENYKINNHDPAVIMVGCHYDHAEQKFAHFSPGEYDEMALWSRELVKDASRDETLYFIGGFSKNISDSDLLLNLKTTIHIMHSN